MGADFKGQNRYGRDGKCRYHLVCFRKLKAKKYKLEK